MDTIERIRAREILDSRGLPTVEVETSNPSRLKSTTSLSFPHRGYCSLSWSTA